MCDILCDIGVANRAVTCKTLGWHSVDHMMSTSALNTKSNMLDKVVDDALTFGKWDGPNFHVIACFSSKMLLRLSLYTLYSRYSQR